MRGLVVLLLVAAAAAQDLPHAFPREGTRQIYEDDYVRAWDVTWPLHKRTPLHRHQFDYVGVELADAKVLVTPVDGVAKEVVLKRGGIFVLPKGTAHVEEGISEPGRHAVILDLKDVPVTGMFSSAGGPVFDARNARKLAETERIVVWDFTWPLAPKADYRYYETNAYLLIVDGGELTTSLGDRKTQRRKVAEGEVVVRRIGPSYGEFASKGRVQAIVVVLKPRAKTQ